MDYIRSTYYSMHLIWKQLTEQDIKYLEDLQEEFDFRFKTICNIGKLWRKNAGFQTCMCLKIGC